MPNVDLQSQIEGAEAYEALHVPALFGEWPPRLLDAAGVEAGHRVLDVACGTGVLAREAARRVGPRGFVAGLDQGDGMLAVASRLAPEVEWQLGTAESLPYSDRHFNAVASQFGLMFFRDRHQAIQEMERVLVPGGGLAVAVWAALESAPAYQAEVTLVEHLAGRAAAEALRAPFALGDPHDLLALGQDAGFEQTAVETHHGTARFPSVRLMVEADLRGWLPIMGVVLEEELIERILHEAEEVLRPFVTPEGRVVFGLSAHIFTGRRSVG